MNESHKNDLLWAIYLSYKRATDGELHDEFYQP